MSVKNGKRRAKKKNGDGKRGSRLQGKPDSPERGRGGAARGQWRLLDIPLGLAGAGVFRSFSAKPPVTPVDIDCKPPLEKEKGSGRESGKRSRLLARGPAVLWESAGRKGWFSAHFSLRFHLPWVGPFSTPGTNPGRIGKTRVERMGPVFFRWRA